MPNHDNNPANPFDEGESEALPIHKDFHSLYEGRPFLICTTCGERLKDFSDGYVINKNFHGDEVIMESALCLPCYTNLAEGFSPESIEAIMEWQFTRSRDTENDPQNNDYECEFCEATRVEALNNRSYFQLICLCRGELMLEPPKYICEDCQLAMNEKLSLHTRRRRQKFIDDHFPGLPADSLPDPAGLTV